MLTASGADLVVRYLGGDVPDWGAAFMIGGATSADVTPASTDTFLTYPFLRFAHDSYGYSLSPTRLAKSLGTVPTTFSGVVTEIGLYPAQTNGENIDSFLKLTDFTSTSVDAGSWTIEGTNRKFGSESLKLSISASGTDDITISSVNFNLSNFSASDDFTFAVHTEDANLASVKVDLMTDDSNYYSYTISSFSLGWNLLTFSKSNFSATGAPSWGNIAKMKFTATASNGGATVANFDGLIIQDTEGVWNDYALVSHAIVSPALTIALGDSVQVEYELTVDLG